MDKYSASFDITISVSYDFDADSEEEALNKIEGVNAQDVFDRSVDGLVWQWDEVDSKSIVLTKE